MSSTPEHDYLWDRSGEPDAAVARLERLLAPLGHKGRPPALPPRRSRLGVMMRVLGALAAAAVVVLAAGAAWFGLVQPRLGWAVEPLAGRPEVDGRAVDAGGRLTLGKWLTTDANSRARVAVGQIGRVEVEPNTRVQLMESRAREHRMALATGTIHARIWAPPKFFFVNTPSAVAIDLGCAYTLKVNEDGSGLLRVTHGWVGFEHAGRESFIPEGAMCATRPGVGPGTPRYEDAPPVFGDALDLLDFGDPSDPRRAGALDRVLAQARPRDALTLWHLLTRGTPDERAGVYERMVAIAPPPDGVTREAVLGGDRHAIDRWWNSLGLESTTWWRLWKRTW